MAGVLSGVFMVVASLDSDSAGWVERKRNPVAPGEQERGKDVNDLKTLSLRSREFDALPVKASQPEASLAREWQHAKRRRARAEAACVSPEISRSAGILGRRSLAPSRLNGDRIHITVASVL
jgi:hypothetical protein